MSLNTALHWIIDEDRLFTDMADSPDNPCTACGGCCAHFRVSSTVVNSAMAWVAWCRWS